jgi:hypothetical protein
MFQKALHALKDIKSPGKSARTKTMSTEPCDILSMDTQTEHLIRQVVVTQQQEKLQVDSQNETSEEEEDRLVQEVMGKDRQDLQSFIEKHKGQQDPSPILQVFISDTYMRLYDLSVSTEGTDYY